VQDEVNQEDSEQNEVDGMQFTPVYTRKYITEDKSRTDTTKTKDNPEKANNTKYSKTKLARFSRFLRHSARKQGGLVLQSSRAHTGPES